MWLGLCSLSLLPPTLSTSINWKQDALSEGRLRDNPPTTGLQYMDPSARALKMRFSGTSHSMEPLMKVQKYRDALTFRITNDSADSPRGGRHFEVNRRLKPSPMHGSCPGAEQEICGNESSRNCERRLKRLGTELMLAHQDDRAVPPQT